MDLRSYEQDKFAIADLVRSAALLGPRQNRDCEERTEDLLARLAEDRFNLVVVGRFNRGKTSLMNAILATDRLPMGIVPLTCHHDRSLRKQGAGDPQVPGSHPGGGSAHRRPAPLRHATGQSRQHSRPANRSGATAGGVLAPRDLLRRPPRHCPFCTARSKAERDAVATLRGRLVEDEARALNTLTTICVPDARRCDRRRTPAIAGDGIRGNSLRATSRGYASLRPEA
jgi:hypothetical protein